MGGVIEFLHFSLAGIFATPWGIYISRQINKIPNISGVTLNAIWEIPLTLRPPPEFNIRWGNFTSRGFIIVIFVIQANKRQQMVKNSHGKTCMITEIIHYSLFLNQGLRSDWETLYVIYNIDKNVLEFF